MKTVLNLIAAALMIAGAPAVHALSNVNVAANGNEIVGGPFVDSLTRQLGVDIGFKNNQAVTLSFTLDADDVDATYSFNSIIDNLTGLGFGHAYLTLDGGARFASLGSLTAPFSPFVSTSLNAMSTQAHIEFGAPEYYGFTVGNPHGDAGLSDWGISFAGLSAGQSVGLTITTAVPEPETYALMLAGFAAVAATRRFKK